MSNAMVFCSIELTWVPWAGMATLGTLGEVADEMWQVVCGGDDDKDGFAAK